MGFLSLSLIGMSVGCLGRGAEGSHGPAPCKPACRGPEKHDSISDLLPLNLVSLPSSSEVPAVDKRKGG